MRMAAAPIGVSRDSASGSHACFPYLRHLLCK